MRSSTHPSTAEPLPSETSEDAAKLFTIGELAEEFGITTRAIRFYESRGLIRPARRGANRSYSRRDRARLILILRAKNLGFTLEDVAEYLDLYDADPGHVAQTRLLLDKVEAHIQSLQTKRADIDRTLRDLKDIRARCAEFLKSPSEVPTADSGEPGTAGKREGT